MRVKPQTAVLGVVVFLVAFVLIVNPAAAADSVRAAIFFVAGAVDAVYGFFDSILNG